jgi:hypothetical protein
MVGDILDIGKNFILDLQRKAIHVIFSIQSFIRSFTLLLFT